MRTSRLPRLLALLTALALLAAACGGSGFQGDDGGDAAGAAGGDGEGGADGGGDVTSLTLAGFASSQAEDDQLRTILDAYTEETGIEVEFTPSPDYETTLRTQLASGNPPDVFYVNDNQVPDLAEAGTLAPAEDNVEGSDDFYPALVEAFTYEDTWYCPAKDFSTLGLAYNPAMLEEAGVEPPTTWDELAAAAEALTTGDRVGLVMGPEWYRWGAFAQSAGGGITNDDNTEMTADSEPVRAAFEYLQGLFDQGFAATPTELDAGWAGEAFAEEAAAMTVEGNWLVPFLRDQYPDLQFEIATLPEGPDGQGTFSFSVCYAVPQAAESPEASWDLVNFLVSPEQQLAFTSEFTVMPSRPSLADQWLEEHPDLQPFLDSAEFAVPPVYVPEFTAVLDVLNAGIQGIATGNRQVDQVLQDTQEAGQGVIGG